ncbi:sarcosine oxidase subunit delta [Siculibacillus lacustris]|uniref:sarcosine oxidase subunit delta n=1 Tax=Siculibacillus lacustris TaxID=1549641 RepID=UPI0026B8AFDA
MILISCPWCGDRDQTEFAYGGDATVQRPAPDDADPTRWFDYVHTRDNPRGSHRELWFHAFGCRQWVEVTRDTATHAVAGAVLAGLRVGEGETP